MIQWFKDGNSLPKRYVWEIVLGAHAQFEKESSMVEVDIEEGVTCDVIGDVHGKVAYARDAGVLICDYLCRPILRRPPSILTNGTTD
jgi:hypothetical protein